MVWKTKASGWGKCLLRRPPNDETTSFQVLSGMSLCPFPEQMVGGWGGCIVFVGQFGVCLTVLLSSSTSTNDMMRSFISGSLTLTPFVLTKFCRNEFSLMIYIHTYTLLRSLLFHYYLFFFFLMSARGAAAAAAAGVFFLDFIPNCFLVSYSCTAYEVYSTVVQLFEFNEALPRLQVF